jgi:HEAT repeat protein
MPKSPSELRRQLGDIEPTERTYAGLDPSDVDGLRALLDDEEAWLAARAVHALARISAGEAVEALRDAARSPRPEVRVAVASSAPRLPTAAADDVLAVLLEDPQAGVRKFAIRSVAPRNSAELKERLARVAATEKIAGLRRLARDKARDLGGAIA